MAITINVNNLTLCHKASGGKSKATLPDFCFTPASPTTPVSFPNFAFSKDLVKGTTTIHADGGNMCANYGSEFFKSTGDELGTLGGVISRTFIKEATWITFSFDVKYEGKGACRLTDKMFHNHMNTVNMSGLVQKELGLSDAEFCELCKKCRDSAKASMKWSQKMQFQYQIAAIDPSNKTGADVDAAVTASLGRQGIQTTTAGTTDSSGNVKIKKKKNKGPCDDLGYAATNAHEQVHKKTQQELEKKHGVGTAEFDKAWEEPKGWADDEVKAYKAGEDYMKQFLKECQTSCP